MKTIFPLFLLFLSCFIFGQETIKFVPPSPMPPSPVASSLGKYGEFPVGYNTGTPNINIPIYEINCNGICIPIALNYHASGVRVDDNASWVGQGWSLNAGGVITRTIKGGATDESTKGYFYYDLPTQEEILDVNEIVNISEFFSPQRESSGVKILDREPDLFYYNFIGTSGKLYYNKEQNSFIPKPYSNIKIEVNSSLDNWELTDQTGVIYTFGSDGGGVLGEEITSPGTISSYISSWYLTKVYNPKTNTSVFFEYEDNTTSVNVPVVQSFEWYFMQQDFYLNNAEFMNNFPSTKIFDSGSSFQTVHRGNRTLKKITYPSGYVEFITGVNRIDLTGAVELKYINIFNKQGQQVKSIEFKYDFSGKLFLEGLSELDTNTNEVKPFVFKYYDKIPPYSNSKFKQDFWGFYNGATYNRNLIPAIYNVNNPRWRTNNRSATARLYLVASMSKPHSN